MFDLCDVLQLIIDGLDYSPLAQQYQVIHGAQSAFHVGFQFRYQLYPVNEKSVEEFLADIAFVPDKFPVDELTKPFIFNGSRSSTSPGVTMKLRISPLSLQTRCSLKP